LVLSLGTSGTVWFVVTRLVYVWLVVNLGGLGVLTIRNVFLDMPLHKARLDSQAASVSRFVATGGELSDRDIPSPQRDLFRRILDTEEIRNVLPVGIREPLRVLPQGGGQSRFSEGGYDRSYPAKRQRTVWGSFSARGPETVGEFRGLVVKRRGLPLLRFELAGDFGGDDVFVNFRDERDGRCIPTYGWQPVHFEMSGDSGGKGFAALVTGVNVEKHKVRYQLGLPRQRWKKAYVICSTDQLRLLAVDRSKTKWRAFSEPREMGFFSYCAARLTGYAIPILLLGSVIIGISFLRMHRGRF